jgi:hypothetical protein
MANVKITDLPLITGITINDVIPIVDVDTVVTSKVTIGDLKDYFDTPFTGGTVSGDTEFTNGLTANTISATTYFNLPTDVFVTGGTYSAGTITFVNNIGNTFIVSGITNDDWQYTEINISSTQILNMGTNPIELLPAPGAGKYYIYEITIEKYSGVTGGLGVDFYFLGTGNYIGSLFDTLTLQTNNQGIIFSSSQTSEMSNGARVYTTLGSINETLIFTTYNGVNPTPSSTTAKAKIKYKIETFG